MTTGLFREKKNKTAKKGIGIARFFESKGPTTFLCAPAVAGSGGMTVAGVKPNAPSPATGWSGILSA